MPSSMLPALLYEIFSNVNRRPADNIDYWRFPELAPKGAARWREGFKAMLHSLAGRFGLIPAGDFPAGHAGSTLAAIIERLPDYERTYFLLATPGCRELLLRLLAFRVLSNLCVRLPQNNPDCRRLRGDLERGRYRDSSAPPVQAGSFPLFLYDLTEAGFPMRVRCHPANVLYTFLLQQYRCRTPSASVAVRPGDTVLDGGACWGDTTLYFADRCGEAGKVFGFEFLPDNLRIVEENLARNPRLASRVEVVERALWDRSGELLGFTGRGPGTSLIAGKRDSGSVLTTTVDDFVAERSLGRVDFIKMDIEGAEMRALRGAESTLRRFRPRLAISVYHLESDLIDVPRYIDGLGLGYKLFLDHFTMYNEETVLFAEPV